MGVEGLSFRPMMPGDLDAVVALESATNPVPWSRALFASELAQSDTCTWLLGIAPFPGLGPVEGGGLAAMGGFWRAVDEAHITNLAVDALLRRRGVGRALVTTLLQEARRQGCRSATLEVRPSNTAALALYESCGFRAVARRPRYYPDTQEDAVLMWREDL